MYVCVLMVCPFVVFLASFLFIFLCVRAVALLYETKCNDFQHVTRLFTCYVAMVTKDERYHANYIGYQGDLE